MTNVATMMDTIGADCGNIPTGTAFVGAYVSGTGDVPWSEEDLAKFPVGSLIRIYQGAGVYPGIGGYVMIDCENGAVTPPQCASEIEKRVDNGYQWTMVYATEDNLILVAEAVQSLGRNIFPGHIAAFLADWNLNEQAAEAKLGTTVAGIGIVGVQWASPSSNPKTPVPNSGLTLGSANIDLSVVDADFMHAILAPKPVTPPSQPPLTGMVVFDPQGSDFGAKNVESTDGGTTWTVQQ